MTLYNLAHVTGWDPQNLHDLAHVSWDGDLYWVNPPQPLGTAGEELLDDLDHDVS